MTTQPIADLADEVEDDDPTPWNFDEPGVVRVEIAREDGMRAAVMLGLQVTDVDDPDRLGVAVAAAAQAAIGGFYLGREDDAVDAHQAAAAALSRSLA